MKQAVFVHGGSAWCLSAGQGWVGELSSPYSYSSALIGGAVVLRRPSHIWQCRRAGESSLVDERRYAHWTNQPSRARVWSAQQSPAKERPAKTFCRRYQLSGGMYGMCVWRMRAMATVGRSAIKRLFLTNSTRLHRMTEIGRLIFELYPIDHTHASARSLGCF